MYDLTEKIIQFGNKHKPRTKHRYSAKDIWAMTTTNRDGELYLTPEKWLKGEEKDYDSCLQMWRGVYKHQAIQMLFPEYKQEVKIEYRYKHLTIVGMADFLDEDIIDLKTSKKLKTKAPPWDISQIKIYLTIFDRQIGRLWQPIIKGDKVFLNEFGVIKRSDKWFESQMLKVLEFDNKCELLWKKNRGKFIAFQ